MSNDQWAIIYVFLWLSYDTPQGFFSTVSWFKVLCNGYYGGYHDGFIMLKSAGENDGVGWFLCCQETLGQSTGKSTHVRWCEAQAMIGLLDNGK